MIFSGVFGHTFAASDTAGKRAQKKRPFCTTASLLAESIPQLSAPLFIVFFYLRALPSCCSIP